MTSRLRKAGIAGGITAAGVLAVAIVGDFEGLRTSAYRDVIGIPTICFGETKNVRMGQTKTVAECKAMLGDRLVEFEGEMRRCLRNPDAIPDRPYVAFLSLSYNIGSAAFCKSSVAKLINAGDLRGACNRLVVFDRAGGRKIAGLVRRRAEERQLCLEGL